MASFAVIETMITRGFKRQPKDQEATEIVALGSSLSLVSIALAVGTAWLLATVLPEAVSWLIGPFSASLVYVAALGAEMSVARRIEEARNIE